MDCSGIVLRQRTVSGSAKNAVGDFNGEAVHPECRWQVGRLKLSQGRYDDPLAAAIGERAAVQRESRNSRQLVFVATRMKQCESEYEK